MTERSRDEHKKIFDEIMESLKEYSTQKINDLETAEYDIVKLLKTHRAVKRSDYKYGLSKNLMENHRLIIKEPEDGSKVREYSKFRTVFHCSYRNAQSCLCKSSSIKIVYGILFAPTNHNENCETKEYTFVMEIQDLLEQGKKKEAQGLMIRGRSWNKSIHSSFASSSLNEFTLSNADVHNNSSVFDESDSESTTSTASFNSDLSPPILERFDSTPTQRLSPLLRSSDKRKVDDDYCIIIDKPATKKPKIEEQPIAFETVEFHHPSTFLLKQVCKKFNIENKESYQNGFNFWRNIVFHNILTVPKNVQTHSFKSPNIFAALSLLFTGKPDSCFLIQHIINEAFRENPEFCGTKSIEEINQILINNIVSDEQIEFIAKFLGCRIGIYYGKTLKKFGKWENQAVDEDILTLILSFDAGVFSVVLDLS